MKAVFIPQSPRPSNDLLTQPLWKYPAGTRGRLRAVTDEEAAQITGPPILEGASLDAIASAHGITRWQAPVPVPQVVPAWRLRAVAKLAGLDAQIDTAIASLPEPTKTVVWGAWNEGTEIHRTSATMTAMQSALSLSDAQIDGFFRQAAALAV